MHFAYLSFPATWFVCCVWYKKGTFDRTMFVRYCTAHEVASRVIQLSSHALRRHVDQMRMPVAAAMAAPASPAYTPTCTMRAWRASCLRAAA